MDRKVFYDTIRPHMNLTTQNVQGMEKLLDYVLAGMVLINLQRLAYCIATAWWESAQTMHPVKEAYWKDEAWRKKNLRYFPWYGRGLVQTTWEDNYRRIAVAMGLPEDTFLKNPDLLLTFEYALPALFVGMQLGIYTGKDLDDYIDDIDESDAEDLREYIAARRIVNATDKAETIGRLALTFEKALKASGFKPEVAEDDDDIDVVPPPVPPSVPATPEPQEPEADPNVVGQTSRGFNSWVIAAIAAGAAAAAYYLFG